MHISELDNPQPSPAQRRKALGATMLTVAVRAGVTPSTICRFEAGRKVNPATERVILLALDALEAEGN